MLATRIKERDLPEKVNVRSGRVNQTEPVAPPRKVVANEPGMDEPLISSQPVTERRIVVDPAPAEAIPQIPAYRPRLTADEREFLSYVARAYWLCPAGATSDAVRVDDNLNFSSLIGELFCGVRVLAVAHIEAQDDRVDCESAAATGHCVTLVLEAPYGDRAEAIYLSRFGPVFQVFNGSRFVLHQIIPQVNPAVRQI